MAVRYLRNIKPDRLASEQLEVQCQALYECLRDQLKHHLSSDNGWVLTGTGAPMTMLATNGHYHCALSITISSDLENVYGQGMVRYHSVLLSATSSNQKRVKANNTEVNVTQKFQRTFATIGAMALGIPGLLFQVFILRRISIYLTPFFFILGSLIGGLFGYLSGSQVGKHMTRDQAITFDDEVDIGVARTDWERFIESITEPVNEFCFTHENRPSQPTVI